MSTLIVLDITKNSLNNIVNSAMEILAYPHLVLLRSGSCSFFITLVAFLQLCFLSVDIKRELIGQCVNIKTITHNFFFTALSLTNYFSRTKVLWLKCFCQKKRLWINNLARLNALSNEIEWDHRNSILDSSSSFIRGQSLFRITSDQEACLRDKTKYMQKSNSRWILLKLWAIICAKIMY